MGIPSHAEATTQKTNAPTVKTSIQSSPNEATSTALFPWQKLGNWQSFVCVAPLLQFSTDKARAYRLQQGPQCRVHSRRTATSTDDHPGWNPGFDWRCLPMPWSMAKSQINRWTGSRRCYMCTFCCSCLRQPKKLVSSFPLTFVKKKQWLRMYWQNASRSTFRMLLHALCETLLMHSEDVLICFLQRLEESTAVLANNCITLVSLFPQGHEQFTMLCTSTSLRQN